MPVDPHQSTPLTGVVPGASFRPQTQPPAAASATEPAERQPLTPVPATPSTPASVAPPAPSVTPAMPPALSPRPSAAPVTKPAGPVLIPAAAVANLATRTPHELPVRPIASSNPNHLVDNLAIAALVLGAVAIPASLLSLLTIFIPVLGLVFGIIALKSNRHGLALAGVILSALGLLLSLALLSFGLWAKHNLGNGAQNQFEPTPNQNAATIKGGKTLQTACYNFKLPTGLVAQVTTESCKVQATTANHQADFVVSAHTPPYGFTVDQLPRTGDAIINEIISQNPGTLIASKQTTDFAGKQAYRVNVTEANKQKGFFLIVYTLKPYTAAQYQLFLIGMDTAGNDTPLKAIEQSWQWR